MPRKRHKKHQINTPASTPDYFGGQISPAPQAFFKRMASEGVDSFEDIFILILNESAQLAGEPEFKDLFMVDEITVEVTERWMRKYEKRLAAAEKKDPDKHHEVLDDMRIQVIDELATPAFRKDVEKRLQSLLDRLMKAQDLDKFELVTLLQPLLSNKRMPWGICGLIIEIYNRTIQRAMRRVEDEFSIFGSIVEALKAEGQDEIDFDNILEHPEKLELIGHKLFEAHPELRQRAEEQVLDMVDTFEDEVAQGNVDLDLFSEEELVLPFQRLQAEFSEPFKDVQPTDEMRKRTFDAICLTITEIMIPERFRRFRDDVEKTAKTWHRAHQKWAAALQYELGYLEGDQYEENKFILAAFIGQVERIRKESKPFRKSRKRKKS
jgi:hypothetical protein